VWKIQIKISNIPIMKQCILILCVITVIAACQQKKLPILGEPETIVRTVDGKQVKDTIYPSIPDFSFINQDGSTVTQRDFEGKIYIADFFFTTCPTICPVMKKNMLKVYDRFKDNPQIRI
jgi:protein SCO1/2